MTDTIEQKAQALVNVVMVERGWTHYEVSRHDCSRIEALCRAIEQLEAEKAARAAYRQEVSDAVEKYSEWCKSIGRLPPEQFARFIIAKPDPLVEALDAIWPGIDKAMVEALRAAIEKRGGKIVWGEG